MRECLDCGMLVERRTRHCPKCDADLLSQTDGSSITVDIAHHGEHVRDALLKLDRVMQEAKSGYCQSVRLVVGRGLIRDEIIHQLQSWKRTRKIVDFGFDGGNEGALLVLVRPPHGSKRR